MKEKRVQGDSSAVMSISDGGDGADAVPMDSSASEMLVNMNYSSLDEFYPAVAIATLMRVVKDPTLSHHHNSVVTAVMFIFKSLGVRCVPYIKQVRSTHHPPHHPSYHPSYHPPSHPPSHPPYHQTYHSPYHPPYHPPSIPRLIPSSMSSAVRPNTSMAILYYLLYISAPTTFHTT